MAGKITCIFNPLEMYRFRYWGVSARFDNFRKFRCVCSWYNHFGQDRYKLKWDFFFFGMYKLFCPSSNRWTTMFETTACRTINHFFMFSACWTNSNYWIILLLFLLFSCLLRLFCLCFLRLSLALFVNVRCFFFFFFRSKRCSYLVGVRWIMCNVLLCIMTQRNPCNTINK